jgi:N-acetylglucosamine-6-phosphate deacetylase
MIPIILVGPTIYTEDQVLTGKAICIAEGVIQAIDILSVLKKQFPTAIVYDFPAHYSLVPGFIDMHVHGANGCDVMDATPDALNSLSQALAAEGTTSFLATTMTEDIQKIETAILAVSEHMNKKITGARILGLHLEGPFLALTKMGAQRGDKIISPNIALMQRWQSISNNNIKLVTLAPEQPDSLLFIQYLQQQRIIASMGHSDADYTQSMAAIDAGCSHATHLFNAMRGIHHREPGMVTAALLSERVQVELIVDGLHLHPAIVQLVLKTKGKENIVLVTDAMRAKCLGDGRYDLGGQTVTVETGQARLADGTLAGSVLPMSVAIQNTMQFTGCDLQDAIKMASENPAKALGVFDQKGSIAPGKDADLVILDDAMHVIMTWCEGQLTYSLLKEKMV